MPVRLIMGDESVTIDPAAGGRAVSLVAAGRERLIRQPPEGTPGEIAPLMSGMYLMAPWVGRLRHGTFEWRGRTYEFPRNFAGHAIHGLVADRPWKISSRAGPVLELEVELRSCGWPFDGRVIEQYRLEPGSLTATATIEAREAMPVSLGWHPWLARPKMGDVALTLDADRVLVTDKELVPTGETMAADGDLDLRGGLPLAHRRLDHVYIPRARRALVILPDWRLEMTFSRTITSVVVHSPSSAYCIEGQTAWPNAHGLAGRLGEATGLTELAPGERLVAEQRWVWWPGSDAA
jgi:aldose 1-epimerase